MSKTTFNLITLLYLTIFFFSCDPEKKLGSLVYFNESGDTTLSKIVQNTEPVIQPGDRLSIAVYALNPASAAPYNLGSAGVASTGSASGSGTSAPAASSGSGYVVESDGSILFPGLGRVQASGLHRKELIDVLTTALVKYVTDPIVTIQFLNFKITVLGEVNRPGTIAIPEGKVTLVEAIGLSGDLTYYSRRDNIIVIREKNGKREFGRVNMLTKNAFSSPYFVLQQNDVVYVELTKGKAASTDQSFVRNLAIGSTILTVLSSLVVLIINVTR